MCRFGQVNYTSQNSVRGGSGRSGGWVRVSRELRREARSVHTWDLLIRWPGSGACGLLPVPPAHPASGPGVHVQVHDKGLDPQDTHTAQARGNRGTWVPSILWAPPPTAFFPPRRLPCGH